jgi:transposase
MDAALLPDPLLDLIGPFLSIPRRGPQGGRPRVSDRTCLAGIVFVLRSGILWRMLPQELGCGSRMTCRRRLRDCPTRDVIAYLAPPTETGVTTHGFITIHPDSRPTRCRRHRSVWVRRTEQSRGHRMDDGSPPWLMSSVWKGLCSFLTHESGRIWMSADSSIESPNELPVTLHLLWLD